MTCTGEPQVSTTDADARALLVQGQVVEVCYNVQAAVDDQYKLIVATHTINRNDRNALSEIAMEAKENLNAERFQILVDKGYHNGNQIQQCTTANITTIVAYPVLVNTNETGTTKEYMVSEFAYKKQSDSYMCPQGATLTTKGTWHNKKEGDKIHFRFQQYRTPKCKTCPVKNLCTAQKGGRVIQRSEYAEAVEANAKRYKENKELYKKRQEINEHIFGTIKRKWGYNHTNLKGLKKVNGEMALIMTFYNMKRCITILGVRELINKIKNWTPDYTRIPFSLIKTTTLNALCTTQNLNYKLAA